jgi:hypothetical protein
VDIIARYTQTFLLLQRYDSGLLVEPQGMPAHRLLPFLFVEFLHRNGRLTRRGEPVINDVGLAEPTAPAGFPNLS